MLFFAALILPKPVAATTCFICSLMSGKSCPSLTTDPSDWSKKSVKYYTITGSRPDEVVMCAVAFGINSGKVFYQVRSTYNAFGETVRP